jgi:hypothetical protein
LKRAGSRFGRQAVFDRGKAERMLYLLDTNVFSRRHATG